MPLACVLALLPVMGIAHAEAPEAPLLEVDFWKGMKEAYRTNDRQRGLDLFRRAEPNLGEWVLNLASHGIKAIAKDGSEEGQHASNDAAFLAALYLTEFGENGWANQVAVYRHYSEDQLKNYLKAWGFFEKGIESFTNNHHDEAAAALRQATALYEDLEDKFGKGLALLNLGVLHTCKGQLREATISLEEALELALELNVSTLESLTVLDLGWVKFREGKFTEAFKDFQDSLEMSIRSGDNQTQARALMGVGLMEGYAGQYTKALDHLNDAYSLAQTTNSPPLVAHVQIERGRIYSRIGLHREAVAELTSSFPEMSTISCHLAEYDEVAGDITLNQERYTIFNAFYDIVAGLKGRMPAYVEHYQNALNDYRQSGDSLGQINVLMKVGHIWYRRFFNDKALQYYGKALQLANEKGIKNERVRAEILLGMAHAHVETKDEASRALAEVNESLELASGIGDFELEWRAHAGLGRIRYHLEQHCESLDAYGQAIELIERYYGLNVALGEEARLSLLMDKRETFQRYLDVLLEMHSKFPHEGYDKRAFTLAERVKSRLLQELLAKGEALQSQQGDPQFREKITKEHQLTTNVAQIRQNLADVKSGINPDVRKQLTEAEFRLRKYQEKLDSEYPRYADLKRPKEITVAEVQVHLRPGHAMVSYAVGFQYLAAFVIKPNHFDVVPIRIWWPYELRKQVAEFREGFKDITHFSDLKKFRPKAAHDLYQTIFEPVELYLRGISYVHIVADDMLYTVPFEALVDQPVTSELFPKDPSLGGGKKSLATLGPEFVEAAAKAAKAEERARKDAISKAGIKAYLGEYSTLHYLLDRYTFTYLPSASVLRSLRQYVKPGFGNWHKPLVAFADPIFGPEEDSMSGGMNNPLEKDAQPKGTAALLARLEGTRLIRLKDSGEEAEAVKNAVQGYDDDVYTRKHATEENVYQGKLKEARYLLFSTHGLLGGDFRGIAEPSLALTQIGNPPNHDGFLSMSEVLGLDLNAELTVLSACNTWGRSSQASHGEGFAGLTRSFLYAGSRALVVTHWNVESQTSRDIMVEMFKQRSKTEFPSALREAKRHLKGTTQERRDVPYGNLSLAHPFFWAPFVFVGE